MLAMLSLISLIQNLLKCFIWSSMGKNGRNSTVKKLVIKMT